jgi:sensor histidine kinase regulating citrate/malate metabolism
MTDTGDCLFFHVFNTCAEKAVREDGLPRTTKPDRENHGFGTKSVRASVSRYGGELVIAAEEGEFHASFFLKKP